ncbi:MAG TPA: VacJ family lipoprotein [Candidatus Baltobacteraceae bacterium]|jgi:ABC-type transporter lipoprotein component MlaA/pimeloyl-ACP methyl ester carboxylesterase|nr:VacJ family lipoprotein [Candidatus Baltobacteraceae bacterium]
MNPRLKLPLLTALVCLLVEFASAQPLAPTESNAPPQTVLQSPAENSVVLPSGFNDPIEPFNRAIWNFDKGFMTSVVRPFSRGYRRVVVKPVRTGIQNIGYNLVYPGRLVNNLLQGNWGGVGDETGRCLCNTVLGVGGFFDVATKLNVPKGNADFEQTFRKWGWKPGFFLMLPIFGPSDERDAVGLAGDAADEPQTYFFPYDLISSGVMANNFSDTVEASVCFTKSQADSYSILEYAWSFANENRKVDMRVIGDQDEATLETLQAIFCNYKNPEFPAKGRTRSVLIPAIGKKLDFTFWLQPGLAPVVYLVPGLGAHRLAGNELALAELLYTHGFSAVCISSWFHPEFMDHASTTDLPSYPPIGVHDVHVALTEIDRRLEKMYPHRLGARALMGYSMGGFQTLFMAAQSATNDPSLLKFERYVAIDAPINLQIAVTNVDQFYDAPLAWPAAERTANIENTLLKVVAVSEETPGQRSNLPFNAIESRFLVGLAFRLSLRDTIFDSQLRHNQGVLKQPLKKSRRWAAYNEIMQYSLWQYIQRFAGPYDKAKGIDLQDPEVLKRGTDLRTYSDALHENPDIRLIANRNDLFLANEDTAWMETTFAPGRLTLFEHGGHTGNLCQPDVQRAILGALDGLGSLKTSQESPHPSNSTMRRPWELGEKDFSQAPSYSNE